MYIVALGHETDWLFARIADEAGARSQEDSADGITEQLVRGHVLYRTDRHMNVAKRKWGV